MIDDRIQNIPELVLIIVFLAIIMYACKYQICSTKIPLLPRITNGINQPPAYTPAEHLITPTDSPPTYADINNSSIV